MTIQRKVIRSRSFGDVGPMSGLPESEHGWVITSHALDQAFPMGALAKRAPPYFSTMRPSTPVRMVPMNLM
jgi:hypothetical protein